LKIEDHMLAHFGTGADQTHVTEQHVRKLGQFIQLPTAQEGANESKALIV
jgi:hypothetical protein